MSRLTDLRVTLAWTLGVLGLIAGFVLVERSVNPPPDGRIALDLLAAVERGDLAAVEAMTDDSCTEPAGTPPSRPWRAAAVRELRMTDPRDVDFAGIAFPDVDATGFGVWVLPGVYEVRTEDASGAPETRLLLVGGESPPALALPGR